MNLRDLILNAKDTALVAVHVPEWGTDVHVRALTIGEREQIDRDTEAKKSGDPARFGVATLIAVRCICNPDGTRVFTDADAEGVSKRSAVAIGRIVSALMDFSGATEKGSADLGEASAGKPASVSPSV